MTRKLTTVLHIRICMPDPDLLRHLFTGKRGKGRGVSHKSEAIFYKCVLFLLSKVVFSYLYLQSSLQLSSLFLTIEIKNNDVSKLRTMMINRYVINFFFFNWK